MSQFTSHWAVTQEPDTSSPYPSILFRGFLLHRVGPHDFCSRAGLSPFSPKPFLNMPFLQLHSQGIQRNQTSTFWRGAVRCYGLSRKFNTVSISSRLRLSLTSLTAAEGWACPQAHWGWRHRGEMKTCPEALCKGFGLHDWFLLHMNSSVVAGIEPNGQGRLKAPFSFLNRRFSSHCSLPCSAWSFCGNNCTGRVIKNITVTSINNWVRLRFQNQP